VLSPVEVEALYPIEKVEVYKNGLVVKRKAIRKQNRVYTPRKGIYEMSKKSKLRLTHIVTNSPIKFVSMITLTWGDFMPPVNGKELKRQLNILLKRFRKRFKNPQYVWFLEFQKKGKPHLHILTTVGPSDFDREWLASNWATLTTKDAWLRLETGKVKDYTITKPLSVEVLLDEWEKSKRFNSHQKVWEMFYKEDGATRYCLKYATKSEQKLVPPQFENVGRFWGVSELVHPEPIGELILNETMDRKGLDKVMEQHRVGALPLLPRYIFEQDALEYFTSRGLKLTEIFGEGQNKFIDKVE